MRKNLQTVFSTRQYMVNNNFELYYYNDSHFSAVRPHSHNYYEFYFFLEGDIAMHIQDEILPLSPGDILLIPPGISHFASSQGKDVPYRRFVFWINKDYYNHFLEFSQDYSYLITQAELHGRYRFHFDLFDFNSMQGRIFELIEEMNADRFGKESMITLRLYELILSLNRIVHGMDHPDTPHGEQHLYQNLIQYIEDHLNEDLTLDQIANAFYLSKYHIAHVFKKNLGLSLHQFITKKRLTMCRDAILGNAEISKAYLMYGFKDYSSFFRAFRKEYGMSPKEYKELYIPDEFKNAPASSPRDAYHEAEDQETEIKHR